MTSSIKRIRNQIPSIQLLLFDDQYEEVQTFSFDRLFTINRNFKNIPLNYAEMLFGQDLLQQKQISLNELAGETLNFEVIIEKVYKTSES